MKILFLLLLFLTLNLFAQKNWIPIQTIKQIQNKPDTPKPTPKIDVNLSQIAPLNTMMRNATLLQQLVHATTFKQKDRVTTNNKNWFILKQEE